VIPLAHVAGMPVEELLPFAPLVWVAICAHLTTRRKRRDEAPATVGRVRSLLLGPGATTTVDAGAQVLQRRTGE
jgi:hypothetical protein